MTVSLGAVGLGLLGNVECGLYQKFDNVDLVAGVDVSVDARERFQSQYDRPAYGSLDGLLTNHEVELDAISIMTPHTLHYEQARAALEADLHVFVEKPMTTKLETAQDLVDTALARDRVLQVGFQRHFDPLFAELRRVVQSGTIGRPHTVNAYLGQQWIADHEGTWRAVPSLSGGGQLFDSGTHLVDSVLWVLDADPYAITGVLDQRGHEVDINSALAATLERGNDTITASLCVCGDGTDPTPHEGMTIWGTEGHVMLTDSELRVTDAKSTREIPIQGDRDFDSLTERKLRNFVDAVTGDAESVVTGEYGLGVTAFLEGAYKTTESGRRVTIDNLDGGTDE